MNKRSILSSIAAVCLATVAWSQDAAPLLKQGVDEVMTIVYSEPAGATPLSARLKPVLAKYFDYESVTKRAIGPAWRSFTPVERERATTLFSDLVLRTYADSFKPGDRPEISLGQTLVLTQTRHEIATTISYKGQNFAVSYRMEKTDSGWRIYDVIVEGVSMIANYRAQFEGILQKGGAKALLQSLEDNISGLTAKT